MQPVATNIEAVFLDIDGTLVKDGILIPSSKIAVRKLQDRGIKVALCTGRSSLHTWHIQNSLELPNAVYFNGGLVVSEGQRLYASPLSRDVVARIIDFFQHHELPIILHTDGEAFAFDAVPDEFNPLLAAFDFPPLHIIGKEQWKAEHEDVFQFNVFLEPSWDQVVQNTFPECLIYRWDKKAIDLQKRGSDKSIGAKALLEYWNVPLENALHIGDGGNDIGMFQTVGLAIAMGNAEPEIQKLAHHVTRHVDDDGVLHALTCLGLI